ncbi:hypothetical protein QFZ49_002037 [Streptomyces turgidiscabies]|uniref:Uncharacterized protein n=1 Tax=Streptomyces turgidiscabies TaxID=85558 RepID=A0ABU0RJD8_9ACTN|nr:hypothetical protein [Streptomyces turgidiscabies]
MTMSVNRERDGEHPDVRHHPAQSRTGQQRGPDQQRPVPEHVERGQQQP